MTYINNEKIIYYNIILIILISFSATFNSNNTYVIISSCPKNNKLNLEKKYIPYKVITLYCNKTTNPIDSYEAGLMLDFIIKEYKKRGRYKYIFIHDHVKSKHYSESVYLRLNYLKKKKYISKVKFGGLYCVYLKFGFSRPYDKMFNRSFEVDKYMRNNGFINISILQLYTEKLAFPCCATFVVDKSRIIQHSYVFYIKLRSGLRQYVLNYKKNKLSANYMEYMWSIIFGIKQLSYPPDCNISYI